MAAKNVAASAADGKGKEAILHPHHASEAVNVILRIRAGAA
jgi:hypothetical protein